MDDSDDYEKHGDTDDDIVLNYDRLCYNFNLTFIMIIVLFYNYGYCRF